MRRRRHGFTLIELLVAIAIIAILAISLFPLGAKLWNKWHPQQNAESNSTLLLPGRAQSLTADSYTAKVTVSQDGRVITITRQ